MINTLKIIKRELKKKHITNTELSRLLGLHQSTVHNMLSSKSMQVERMAQISEVLQYNFFREIAEQFPYEQPVFDNAFKQKEKELTEEINQLKEENKALNIKVKLLKEIIS